MKQSLIFGGDFSIPAPDPAKYLEGVRPLLETADFRMVQLEEAYLNEPTGTSSEYYLNTTLDCCLGLLDLVTLSGNHFCDFEEPGIRGTIDWCEKNGVAHAGGGMTEAEARKPAFVEKDGVRVGVLAYNAVGGKQQMARGEQSGTAPILFERAYIPLDELPWEAQRTMRQEHDVWSLREPVHVDSDCMANNFLNADSVLQFAGEVAAAKEKCDVLLVYMHKGYVHRQITVDSWERLLSHIAIDNGADAVMGSHSHIAHGIEMYKGKAIYHGLNNFVMYTPQLMPGYSGKVSGNAHNEEWIKNRVKRFGFVPDPEYPTYPFHPDSLYCPVAKLVIENKHVAEYRLILMKTEKSGIPYVHGHDETGEEILSFMKDITQKAGFATAFKWDGGEVVLGEAVPVQER